MRFFTDKDILIVLIPIVVCLFIGCILAGIMYYRYGNKKIVEFQILEN